MYNNHHFLLTTVLHQMVEESALLDLKHLLMEAQQRVPPVLMALEDPTAEMEEVGEPYICSIRSEHEVYVSHGVNLRSYGVNLRYLKPYRL